MDPIIALQVASAIIQLVDFGTKLVGVGHEIYDSAQGATEDNVLAEYLISHTKQLCGRFHLSTEPSDGSPDTQKLAELARRCESIANELLEVLKSIRKESSFRSWTLVRRTVMAVCKAERVASLQGRIESVKGEISLLVLCMMSEEQSALSRCIKSQNQQLEGMGVQQRDELEALRSDIMTRLSLQGTELASITAALNSIRGFETQPPSEKTVRERINVATQLHTTFTAELSNQAEHANLSHLLVTSPKDTSYSIYLVAAAAKYQDTIAKLSPDLGSMVLSSEAEMRQMCILKSLRFEDLHLRRDEVREAFPSTFAWLMDEDRSDLAAWLREDSGIFWVSGKPGAGKSTFMKFLINHPKTGESLREWCGARELVIADHFFWSTGTKMQKSQQGLIQGLLFQVLRQRPEVIQQACPSRWHAFDLFGHAPERWNPQELKLAFDLALGQITCQETNICFLLDGLDEYADAEGQCTPQVHYELVETFLQPHLKNRHIKFCVSSRPHNVFAKAFGQSTNRKLVLQDLTAPDMDEFIRGRLERDARFKAIAGNVARTHFAHEIRKRANGVFLWVHVVIIQLLSGLSEGDDMPMLQHRLDQLPTEMIDLYKHIMDQIESVYRVYSARALLLAHESPEPLPFMTFWFLREDIDGQDLDVTVKVGPLSRDDTDRRRQQVAQYLGVWCKGLLELSRAPRDNAWGTWEPFRETVVDFHHRTVKDFLHTTDMAEFVRKSAGPAFDANKSLSRLLLAQSKVVNVYGSDNSLQAFRTFADEALQYAKVYDQAQTCPKNMSLANDISGKLRTVELEIQRARDLTPSVLGALQVPSSKSRSSSTSSRESRTESVKDSLRKFFNRRSDEAKVME